MDSSEYFCCGHSVTLVILFEPDTVDAELKNTACYGPCIR